MREAGLDKFMTPAEPKKIHPVNEDLWFSFVESSLTDMLETVDVTEGDVARAVAEVLDEVVIHIFKMLNS